MSLDAMGSAGPGAPARRTSSGLAILGTVALAASAIVGSNLLGLRDRLFGSGVPQPRPVAVSPFAQVRPTGPPQTSVLRSEPWWQHVYRVAGEPGTATQSFTINGGAIQWRARWSCQRGRFALRVLGRPAQLADAVCPAHGTATATVTGQKRVSVSAGGPWMLSIEQQVNVPLVRPPLPAMTAPGTSIVQSGAFHRIDQAVTGRLNVYRLSSGRFLLRLIDFYVTPNVDLELRLSPLQSPHSTHQFLSVPSVRVAPLNITAGSLNFAFPAGVDPRTYHSLVIWCPLITSAYAAAPLRHAS